MNQLNMTTYKQSGVNIAKGDECSKLAYGAALETFAGRKNMIGGSVKLEGGFSGILDFGDFYLVQNCDGVGSKIAVAEAVSKFDTLGYDLVAMVADDAVCLGAETVSITNTIDTEMVDANIVKALMKGLKNACLEQKIVIPGGEIAEMPDKVKGSIWNADAVGIVEKRKLITGKTVEAGDQIIALRSRGFRSNGFSLARYVLKQQFGDGWVEKQFAKRVSWGDALLEPSLIYSGALLEILGRYGEKRLAEIKALAHVTGGGIPGNIVRVLNGYGADLDMLWEPNEAMLRLQEYGKVSDGEAYQVWNMGTGMLIISNEFKKIAPILKKNGVEAKIVGKVSEKPGIRLLSGGGFKKGKVMKF